MKTATRTARARKAGTAEDAPRGMEPSDGATRKLTRPCPVKLTDGERLERLGVLTQKLTKKEEVERELKDVSDGYKGEIKTLALEIHDITKTLTLGAEERDVECEERFDYDSHVVNVVRLDTGEVAETRAMTPREMTPDLFNGGTAPATSL